MPTKDSIRNILLDKEDEIVFSVSTLLLLALTPHLIEILTRPWSTNGALYSGIANMILFFDPSGIHKIINLAFGFYFISILFLIADEKKRIQTLMLSLVFLFIIINVFIGNIFPHVSWNVAWVFAGFLVGIFANGDNISDGGIIKDILKGKKEYKKPARNLTYISLVTIFAAFLAYYAESVFSNRWETQNETFIWDLIVVCVFAAFFTKFMNYEPKNSSIFVLGPKNSGKSLFLAGAYLNALEAEGNKQISPSEELVELIDEMQKKDWPKRTEKIKEYSFNYRHGKLFPKDTQFYTYDYPGPYLERLYEFMQRYESPIGGPEDDKRSTEILRALELKIKECDKLVLLIDGDRYNDFSDMGIKYYLKILKFLNENSIHKDFYIVLTKCDLFLDEYKKNSDQLIVTDESYEDFKHFINDMFLGSISIKPLLRDTQCDSLYPIFYHTIKSEDGTLVPLKDNRKNIWPPFGYGPLMNDLVK